MTDRYDEHRPLVEEIKATLRRTDVAGQGAALGHALGWWLCAYAGPNQETRQRALELTGGFALTLARFYDDAAADGVTKGDSR